MKPEERYSQSANTFIDLHVHSTESDGTLSPEELVRLAKEQGLAAMALTDHDTVSGLPAARMEAKKLSLELVPGIELSTDYQGTEVHILGYYFNDGNPAFLKKLDFFCAERTRRNKKMVKKLQECGFPITYEDLLIAYPNSVITRAHFARYLTEQGFVKDRNTVFQEYLGNQCRCYVPREKITPFEAIDFIHSGGGVAYFAHPILCRMNPDRLDAFVKSLTNHGLTGLEAVYSTYLPNEERCVRRLAEKYGLKISGGSDFHGANKPHICLGTGTGNLRVPYACLIQMKAAARQP